MSVTFRHRFNDGYSNPTSSNSVYDGKRGEGVLMVTVALVRLQSVMSLVMMARLAKMLA